MPFYDFRCERCDTVLTDLYRPSGKVHTLVHQEKLCHGKLRMIPSMGKPVIFAETVFENIGPEPLRISSKRQLREATKKAGVTANFYESGNSREI